MRYTAKHRFADVGPRKIRQFANLIRGKNVDEALQLLRFYPNRGAKLLMAVVQSAYGNADDQEHPDPDSAPVGSDQPRGDAGGGERVGRDVDRLLRPADYARDQRAGLGRRREGGPGAFAGMHPGR